MARRRSATLGLHGCDAMREPLAEPRTFAPSRSPAAARRRRLARGVERWVQSTRLTRGCRSRVWLVLFTTESSDVEAVQGHIRRFWQTIRQKYGPQQYFSWLELQARGAAHYHAMWIDPPRRDDAATKTWLEATWGLGFVKIRQRRRDWLLERGSAYVTAEVKKWGHQQYQHDYERVPSTIRTFECQRLPFAGSDLDLHRDAQLVAYIPAHGSGAEFVAEHLAVWGIRRHLPGAVCGLQRVFGRHATGPPGASRAQVRRRDRLRAAQ